MWTLVGQKVDQAPGKFAAIVGESRSGALRKRINRSRISTTKDAAH
jgi:hypothetical protein